MALCGWQPACIGVLASVQDSTLPSLALPPLSHGLSSQEAGASVEADPLDAGIGYRALPAASFFLRIFIIWAIRSWFRRGPSPQDQSGPGGAPRVASRNLFPKDTLMVMLGGKELGEWCVEGQQDGTLPDCSQLCGHVGLRCPTPSVRVTCATQETEKT